MMSRFNLVSGLFFLFGVFWVFSFGSTTRLKIQGAVLSVFNPLYAAINQVAEKSEIKNYNQKETEKVVTENLYLKEKLAELTIITETVDELKVENADLREALNFSKRSYQKLLPARVISRPVSNWWSAQIINKGAVAGVATDAPVRSEIGLVGKTAEVESHSTKILLLTDEQCWVAGQIEGKRQHGMVRGQRGKEANRTLLKMQFLDKNIEDPTGLNVYTKGVSGVYPPNILIGEIIDFKRGDIDSEAIIKPAVDFATVKNVFVLLPENSKDQVIREGGNQ